MTSRGPHVYKHEHVFDVPEPSTNQSCGIAAVVNKSVMSSEMGCVVTSDTN